MANVLLLNPRKRKKSRRKGGKKPSAAQLAARRKFIAMARSRARARKRSRFAPLNRTAARRRASKTLRRSVQPAYAGVKPMARRSKLKRNPSRRRRRRAHARRLRRNPVRRLRRNPILPAGFMRTHIKPAAIGALGGLLNDIAVGALISKLPAKMQAPELRHLVKAMTAIGLGVVATKLKIASSSVVHDGIVGALTCVIHDGGRQQVQKMLPGIPMGEYLNEYVLGENSGAWSPPGGLRRIGMGERFEDEAYMPGGEGWYEGACDEEEVIS